MNFITTPYSYVCNRLTQCTAIIALVTLFCGAVSGPALAAQAADWVPAIDAPAWSLALQKIADPDRSARLSSTTLSSAQRALLLDISPLIKKQQYQQGLELLNERAKDSATLTDSALILGLRGQLYMALAQFKKARADFAQALELEPENRVLQQNMASTLLELGQLNEARPHLVSLLGLGEVSAQLYGQLGYINLQTQHPLSAVSAYQNAFSLAPHERQWSRGLLYALIQARMTDSAASLLDELLAADADNSVLWLQRAQIALQQDQPDRAIASIEQAINLDKNQQNNSAALLQLASLHGEHGSSRRAADLLANMQKAVSNSNDSQLQKHYFDTLRYVSEQLIAVGNDDRLSELFKQIDNSGWSAQQRSSLQLLKAKWYQQQGRSQASQSLYREAIATDPTNAVAILALANQLLQQHQLIEAQLLYQRANSFDSTQEQALLGLAQIAIEQADHQRALALLRKIYQINPARTEVLKNIQILEQSLDI